jgi:DNA-directed RNA polymerase beta subunit
MIPDVLLSPHSFPSRLTQGHLVESYASQHACKTGKVENATSFESRDYSRYSEHGLEEDMDHWESVLKTPLHLKQMRSGTTGELLTLAVTVEPVYYHVLKHMIDVKGMVRTTGPVNAITRQPVRGRVNGGGGRFGIMEGDCLIAAGCSGLLQERTFVSSDASFIFVCPKCGRQQNSTRRYCICKHGQKFEKFAICHSTKVLIQELQTLNIFLRFNKSNGELG